MILKIKFFIILMTVFQVESMVSQTVDILGKIESAVNIENIHVINKTAKVFTISNANGNFKISVKLNDTVVFSSVQHKTKVLVIDEDTQQIKFSGAKNPLCRVRNGEIERIKGSASAIGGYAFGKKKEYEQHDFPIVAGDVYYLFSDGYQDQFGGLKDKKFMSLKFKNLLKKISNNTSHEQYSILQKEFNKWKGSKEQIDDVCVMGVRIV